MATTYTSLPEAMDDARTLNLNCDLATRSFAAALWFEFKGDDEKAASYLDKAIAFEEKGKDAARE